jgi:cell wall-associated NlpC family hydrolase
VSSADEESVLAGKLIERLLVDPQFRAEFRQDPAQACLAAGLPDLAAELGGSGRAMQTLELRESRSSLAGVVMAVAVEGMGVAEAQALIQHGLPGNLRGIHGARNLLHGHRLPDPMQKVRHAASPAGLQRGLGHTPGAHGGHGLAGQAAPGAAGAAASGGAAGSGMAGSGGASGAAAGGAGAGGAGSGGAGAGGAGGVGAGGAGGVGAGGPGGGGPAAAVAGSAGGGAPAAVAGPGGVGAGAAGGASAGRAYAPAGASAASGQGSAGGNALGTSPPGNAAAAAAGPGGAGAQGGASPLPWPDQAPGSGGGAAASPDAAGQVGQALPQAPGAGASGAATPGGAVSAPPVPGAQPAYGGVASQWPDQQGGAGAGGAGGAVGAVGVVGGPGGASSGGLLALLDSPRLSVPADVRAFLGSGGVDPRLVSVLDSALMNHSIGLGHVEVLSDPVHVQSVDIVSVDGQPVGPANFGARDLVTEIAALDPSVRPSEIGTPWPIRSQGFFSDAGVVSRLHLAFEMPGTDSPPAGGAAGMAANQAAPGAGGAAYPAPGVGQAVSPAAGVAAAVPGQAAGAMGLPGQAAAGNNLGVAPSASSAGSPGAAAVDNLAGAASPSALANDPNYASPKAHAAFEAAKKELGVPYLWGGTSPQTGFDCSGLTQWAYHQVGIDIPRVAADQFHAGTPVDLQHLREGDLVFFQDGTGYIHHVGMYVGNHMFLEAPHTGDVVKYDSLNSPYWAQQFAGGRRIVPLDASATAAGGGAAAPAGAGGAGGAGGAAAVGVSGAPGGAGGVGGAGGAAAVGVAGVPGGPGSPGAPQGSGSPGWVAGPPQPGTPQFTALANQERSFHRHTVQFLQAVAPAPGSPLAQQVPGASASAGGTPGTPGQVLGAQPTPGASAASVQPGATGLEAGQVAGQGPGLTPTGGGVISVTSRLLTPGQEKFAGRLAQLTGLDPRVIAAWQLAEESGGAAQGREQASNFNWLNIGYFDSGAGQIAFVKAFSEPVTAADQTAEFLKGQWGGASPSIRAILNTVGQSPDQQMAAIANSDWASSHYGGGANLHGTYDELSDVQIQRSSVA